MAKPLAKLVALLTPKRRWMQFSLLSMFVAVTVLCVWLGAVVNRANRQRDAVAAIESAGGKVEYDVDRPGLHDTYSRRLRRRWMPRDYTDQVVDVVFPATAKDADLAHLKVLNALRLLSLYGTKVTDADLDHLREMAGLVYVSLRGTKVTPAGAAELRKALPKCKIDIRELRSSRPPIGQTVP